MKATLNSHHASRPVSSLALVALLCGGTGLSVRAQEEFLHRWALTIPGGGAGWLEVHKENGWYDGSILWGGGSVVPVASVFFSDAGLNVTRTHDVRRRDTNNKVTRTQEFTDLLVGTVDGDEIHFVLYSPREDGTGVDHDEFSGKRIPPVPPAPDLGQVKFGEPIELLNGHDLSGWRLVEPQAANGWSIEDGVLRNRPDRNSGKHYGNLRTDREFTDFNLKLDVNVPKDGNSGVYLRGIYEVQVADSHGEPADSHGMGGVYSRITPSKNVAKPAGEWQTLDVTLVDRHVTVVLNGTKVIDNKPLLGCTGGALWSDESKPGPIYLQGDHDAVSYRNIVIRPVAN